jgi:hypothetical protein
LRYLVIAALALSAGACATLSADSPDEEKVRVVRERANARWQAVISKDFDAAYEYLSPASRATVTRAGFKTLASRLQYRAAKVQSVACEAQICKVKLEITYDTPMMKGVDTPLNESWVIEKGQVWFVWPT